MIYLPYDLSIQLIGFYIREMATLLYKDLCMDVYASFFSYSKLETFQLSIHWWIFMQMWYIIFTVNLFPNKKEWTIINTWCTQINHKNVMVSERRRSKISRYSMIPFVLSSRWSALEWQNRSVVVWREEQGLAVQEKEDYQGDQGTLEMLFVFVTLIVVMVPLCIHVSS